MNSGMLWFDNNPKTDLITKIQDAVSYYKSKYGFCPNTCVVNPGAQGADKLIIEDLEIRTNITILPNHFLIGNELK